MQTSNLLIRARCAFPIAAALAAVSCAGGNPQSLPRQAAPAGRVARRSTASTPISHVVIVIQENRTFDDLFATFPGADGTTFGTLKDGTQVPLKPVNLAYPCDFGHSYAGFLKDYDGGKMDGFNLEGGSKKCPGQAGTRPYQYVNPTQIAPYWDIAQQFVLADHMFQTQGSGSFTAHQDLIAGGTILNQTQTQSLVDFPSGKPWGCDAPAGTVTSLLVAKAKLEYRYRKGPFPCLQYATLRDLLDGSSLSWHYYSPPEPGSTGAIWSAFDAIQAVREGPEWATNVSKEKQIFSDISNGTLANVSWVVPDEQNSDHPGSGSKTGPSWVASIVNAVGESSYWDSTAIVVVWDDWGGFYDHEPPPFLDKWGGLGFRVPALVISAYTPPTTSGSYVSHTQYEFGSILKFVEETFALGSLGTTDARATSIGDSFDFNQSPRPFTPIPASYSRAYFERQPPSYKPVDTQ